MHSPSCGSISWSGGVFSRNTAADGGALYLTEITSRSINGSAVYDNNMVSVVNLILANGVGCFLQCGRHGYLTASS